MNNFKNKKFINHLISNKNADIYLVGGYVRDFLIGRPNKDIDLIVRKVKISTLIEELKKFGKVDVVGESSGVIKFKSNEDGIEYDIALPRKESPTGEGGHKGFEINSDENLSIADDSSRRDAKLNSIAYSINRDTLIDPFKGVDDINNRVISMTNPNAFSDDPLRMLRLIGFSSRFNFTIEPNTFKMMQNNAAKINEIAGERILIEFDKIVKKGNKRLGAQLLKDTGIFKQIFGFDLKQSTIDRSPFEDVKTMAEFIFLLTRLSPNPSEIFRNKLKGDIDTIKELDALSIGFRDVSDSVVKNRVVIYNMFLKSPESINSKILPESLEIVAKELNFGRYPKSLKELRINGNDLMTMGLKGKEVGDTLKSLLINVYGDVVENNKEKLIEYLRNKTI